MRGKRLDERFRYLQRTQLTECDSVESTLDDAEPPLDLSTSLDGDLTRGFILQGTPEVPGTGTPVATLADSTPPATGTQTEGQEKV